MFCLFVPLFTTNELGLTPSNTVPVTYAEADGKETTVDAEIGQNLMAVAHDHDIELEGTKAR